MWLMIQEFYILSSLPWLTLLETVIDLGFIAKLNFMSTDSKCADTKQLQVGWFLVFLLTRNT